MIVITNGEMQRMANKRDRYLRIADADQEYAKQLFSEGRKEFADPLKSAHQRYGAALEIDKELKDYGYKKKPKFLENFSDRDIELIIMGLKQKLYGFLFVVIGFLSIIPDKDATAAIWLVPFGIYVMLTKEKIIYERKNKYRGMKNEKI